MKRMGLEYVDIFYHHRPDPNTPLEDSMWALDLIVRQGKALYIGLSNYKVVEMQKACAILKQLGTPCLIHQPRYSMLDRWVEDGLLDLIEKEGVGCIVFSPLAQGVLTGKYLGGIPADSRAAGQSIFLKPESLTDDKLDKVRKLNDLARQRGQTLAQMALAWVLRGGRVTSALIGASKTEQIDDSVKTIKNLVFSKDELDRIEDILKG